MTCKSPFLHIFLRAFSKQGTVSVSCNKIFRKKIHDTLSEPGGLGNKTMARRRKHGETMGELIDWLIVMQDQPTKRLWEVHRGGIFFGILGWYQAILVKAANLDIPLVHLQGWQNWRATSGSFSEKNKDFASSAFTSILGGLMGLMVLQMSGVLESSWISLCDSSVESVLKSKQPLNTKS